ncbi:hypothetical protein KFE25_008107 [Diacronema lutheri]|uniref:Uncharacterized protein n=1 Tax=Diacronema lutheri TaxID=2081491 RepID=A0A8J5XGJ0_DIALT|nr:hypothetical protein KFE25_008107 [Diacronema lutheri]
MLVSLLSLASLPHLRAPRRELTPRADVRSCGDGTCLIIPAVGGDDDVGVVPRKLTPEMRSAARTIWSWQQSEPGTCCPCVPPARARSPMLRWRPFQSSLSAEAWGAYSGEMLLAMASVLYEPDFTCGGSAFEALTMGLAGKQRMRMRAVDVDPAMPEATACAVRAAVLMKVHAMCIARSVDLVVEPNCLLRADVTT